MKCMAINKKNIQRKIALGLIVASFLIYAIMPFNACLPFSVCTNMGITGAMMIVSEIIFWVGGLMIGRDVAMQIRKKFSIKNLLNRLKSRKGDKKK